MVKFYTTLVVLLTIALSTNKSFAQCAPDPNNLQYRIVDSSGFVVIQVRDTGTSAPNPLITTSNNFLGLVFGVKWPTTSTSISLGTVQTYAPYVTCALAGSTFVKSGFYVQSVGDAPAGIPAFPINWVKGTWYNVFRINYSGTLLSTDTFKLCECNFDITTDPYFAYYNNPDYLEYAPSLAPAVKYVPTPTLTANILPNDTLCGTSTITLNGTSNGTVNWYDGTTNYTNGQNISVSSSKTYTVTATNAYGGSTTIVVPVTIHPVPTMTVTAGQVLCNGFSAPVDVAASGGTPPVIGVGTFYYPAGTFTLYVLDANGCTAQQSVTLTQPTSISTSYTTVTPRICHNGYASFNVSASGGFPPYTNTGLFTTNADSITLTIYDSIGCEGYATFILPNIPMSTFITNYNSPLYSGDSLKIDIDTSFGGTNYAYVVDTNLNILQNGTSFYYDNVTSLSSGIRKFVAIDTNGCDAVSSINVVITPAAVINAKAFLQGPYNSVAGTMHDSLRSKGQIPLTEPYSSIAGFTNVFGGGETTTTSMLSKTGANAPVDWVFLQLRNATTPTTVLETKCAIITRNGNIVNPVNGNANITFRHNAPGTYIVSVKHRNHAGLQIATALNLVETATLVDFTNLSVNVFGTDAGKTIGSIRALKTGDANKNRTIKYNGSQNDRQAVLARAGSATGNILGYYLEDLNMDGRTRYNGTSNDRQVILANLATANSVFNEQTSN